MERTYTIMNLSIIFRVDVQTVRRWCREGKIVAEIDSNKKGYLIKDSDLKEFMYKHPKYWFRFRDYMLLND